MNDIVIYALVDPFVKFDLLTNEIRYVGKTGHFDDRIAAHLKGENCNPYKDRWVKKVQRQGLDPHIRVLERHLNEDNFQEREKFWIKFLRELGHRLTNLTDGGEGVVGYKLTDEQKKKRSETLKNHPRRKEINAAISRAQMGRTLSDECKKKISESHFGKKHTDATKEKVRQAQYTPEARERRIRMVASKKGKPWSQVHRDAYLKAKSEGRWGYGGGKPKSQKQKETSSRSGKRIRTPEERKRLSDVRYAQIAKDGPRLHSAETKLKMSESAKAWRALRTPEEKQLTQNRRRATLAAKVMALKEN